VGNWVKVAVAADLPPGQGKTVKAGDAEIALFNAGGTFLAIGNTCCHRGGPLGEGDLDGTVVTCPWHGWQFEMTTGETLHDPSATVPTYRTDVRDGEVFVELP
jgi:nitrite reductase (NADH) small subunit